MQLDTRTLVVVAVLVALVPGILGVLVWQTRRTHPGRWALGNLLAALAMLLLCLRGRVPDSLSIVLANTLIMAAGIAFLQGIRQFRGLPVHWWPECLISALAIAAVIYFRYAVNDINIRVLAVSTAAGGIGIACGITLLNKMPPGRRTGMLITGLAFTLWGTGLFLRGVYIFALAPMTDLLAPSQGNGLFFLAVSIGVVSWSYGFFVLTESASQLRQLATSLQAAREEERTRISRELHDELGQVLTALKMDIEDLAFRVSAGQSGLASQFQSTIARVEGTIRNVRKIATELRPSVLDLGLVDAIDWLLQDFHARTNIQYGLDLPSAEIVVDRDRSTAVFRVLQEALTNITRHASATRVDVRLTLNNGLLILEVRDNGKGIPELQMSGRTASLGILGMRERTMALGGEATIRSRANGGTMVRAWIPRVAH